MKSIEEIIAAVFKISKDQVGDDMSIDNTDAWDSLSHMDLITEIENEFSILLTGDDIADMLSVGSIKEVLSKYV